MKKAGKIVVLTLTMRKSWVSYKMIFYGAHEKCAFTRQPSKPNSKEGQRQSGTRSVSLRHSMGDRCGCRRNGSEVN